MAQRKFKKTLRRELRVGGTILVAIAIMVSMMFALGGQTMFGKKIKYRILFSGTGGLYTGDPVMLTGVEVGNVTDIGFPEDLHEQKIQVEIEVDRDVAPRIRMDSKARIASASIVYGKLVEISMGSMDRDPVPAGAFIESLDPTDMTAVVDSTKNMMTDIRRVLGKIDEGPGLVSQLLNEPAQLQETLRYLNTSSKQLAILLAQARQGKGAVGTLLTDTTSIKSTMRNLLTASANLKAMSVQLNSKESAFGRLIHDKAYGKAVTTDLQRTLHHLANITAKIDSGQGAVGQLINDPAIYYGLQNVVLGIERSSLTKWLVQNRRKSGEKTQKIIETMPVK